jgi:hypothetical protein
MSGNIEFGKCPICGKELPLQRTYWYYDIECECCAPHHFEFRHHCKDCIPIEPLETKVHLRTSTLKHIEQ